MGALHDSIEGHLDPYGTTWAYAKAAKKQGGEIYQNVRVTDLQIHPQGGWRVIYENGNSGESESQGRVEEIHAEHVVNAGGLWAREVGRMVGLELPVLAMEHMYFLTEEMEKPKIFRVIFDLVSGIYAGISKFSVEINGKPLLSQQYIKYMYGDGDVHQGVHCKLYWNHPSVEVNDQITIKEQTYNRKDFDKMKIGAAWDNPTKSTYFHFGDLKPYSYNPDAYCSDKTSIELFFKQFDAYIDNTLFNYFKTDHFKDATPEHTSHTDFFEKSHNDFIDCIQYMFKDMFFCSLPTVEGNRTIPTINETLSFNYQHFTSDKYQKFNHILKKNIPKQDFYWELLSLGSVILAVADTENKHISSKLEIDLYGFDGINFKSLAPIAQQVNKYLCEEMFKDKAYQLKAQIAFVQTVLRNGELSSDVDGVLAHLELIDSIGAFHQIDDVGSGIGYVLPVLAAISIGGIVKIQQPELHLHPALQARLADCFIDASGQDSSRYFNIKIVETHSEHFILRLLRRIKDKKSSLTNDDLSIVYFNTNTKEASSEIKKIRLAKDGTMVDHWPNGFFEERYEDLFNE